MKTKNPPLIYTIILILLVVVPTLLYSTESIEVSEEIAYPAPLRDRSEQVIKHKAYTVSYNADLKIPNWVAYELNAAEASGELKRGNNFRPDPLVKGEVIESSNYTNSGYDRGHMAPAGDMKWDKTAMSESFYLSNICPQNAALNRGKWNDLENKIRTWTTKGDTLYIVCGPLVAKKHKTIGHQKIAVPEGFYKVILSKNGSKIKAIAFVMKNEDCNLPLKDYVLTIDEVEILTGIDFFYQLDDELENKIESSVNIKDWRL